VASLAGQGIAILKSLNAAMPSNVEGEGVYDDQAPADEG